MNPQSTLTSAPTRSAALLVGLLAAPAPALAVDGVIEINQARTLAGGVTPGDAPGFPVTVSQSGSYVLTSNLEVPADTDGIAITSNDVTVDLNGFTISGQGGTSGDGVTSLEPGVAVHERITVRDGVVRGMGRTGVLVGDQSRVEAIHTQGNGGSGIVAREGSTVTGNTAQDNGTGIAAAGSAVTGNTARGNGDDGIFASRSTVTGNTALGNNDDGISAGLGSTVTGNTALGNGGDGIRTTRDSTVTGNTARRNGGLGLRLLGAAGFKGNVLTFNNGGNAFPQVQGGIELGPNVCGTDTVCP